MNVDEKTIRTAVYEEPWSKTYVFKVRQMLFEVSKAKNWLSDNLPMFWSKEIWPLARLERESNK
ncbi:Hypothetical protein FKW44_023569 [Caligus rogercresseyi]|uniref:Uncharacterized protein n=1 Tax=Caligus rogercresseyi TaxID=217165 RepID=A0A7T8JVH1_CALRO|nr:Hypothetical protein FKW44_023569 [Caligus rogercresseyi]